MKLPASCMPPGGVLIARQPAGDFGQHDVFGRVSADQVVGPGGRQLDGGALVNLVGFVAALGDGGHGGQVGIAGEGPEREGGR